MPSFSSGPGAAPQAVQILQNIMKYHTKIAMETIDFRSPPPCSGHPRPPRLPLLHTVHALRTHYRPDWVACFLWFCCCAQLLGELDLLHPSAFCSTIACCPHRPIVWGEGVLIPRSSREAAIARSCAVSKRNSAENL